MLDPRWLREHEDEVTAMLAARNANNKAYREWLHWDTEWRNATAAAESLQAQRNALAKEIGFCKKTGQDGT